MKSIFYPRFVLAGTHSGVGKTTLAVGLMSALRKKGLQVQPFKAGPDYIDPSYHTRACGRISSNLDTWLLPKDVVLELFQRRARNADISVVEGVMGLYDGLRDTEEGSTAKLAKILKAPVILILDARSLSRSAAAAVYGYAKFDKQTEIKGVILNNISTSNHYRYIKSAIEKSTKIPVLGYLPKDHDLRLPQRHLGLVPAPEKRPDGAFHKKLLNLINKHIDISRIIKISREARAFTPNKSSIFKPKPNIARPTIAFAYDAAFNFYYQDNLDILKSLGARFVKFSPLKDKKLPDGSCGVYIGGGFPELFARQLSKNIKLKQDIYKQAKGGMPVYAECGGLMYLMKEMVDFSAAGGSASGGKKKRFPMAGIFRGSVNMGEKLQALGYVNIETLKDNILSKKGAKNRAHVFHWSYLDNLPKDTGFAYKIIKNKDKIFYDGLITKNVLASYAHLHFASNMSFARNFVISCRSYATSTPRR